MIQVCIVGRLLYDVPQCLTGIGHLSLCLYNLRDLHPPNVHSRRTGPSLSSPFCSYSMRYDCNNATVLLLDLSNSYFAGLRGMLHRLLADIASVGGHLTLCAIQGVIVTCWTCVLDTCSHSAEELSNVEAATVITVWQRYIYNGMIRFSTMHSQKHTLARRFHYAFT